jgi:hypothetical protein
MDNHVRPIEVSAADRMASEGAATGAVDPDRAQPVRSAVLLMTA